MSQNRAHVEQVGLHGTIITYTLFPRGQLNYWLIFNSSARVLILIFETWRRSREMQFPKTVVNCLLNKREIHEKLHTKIELTLPTLLANGNHFMLKLWYMKRLAINLCFMRYHQIKESSNSKIHKYNRIWLSDFMLWGCVKPIKHWFYCNFEISYFVDNFRSPWPPKIWLQGFL